MCTLTWWNGPDGYEVFFNRDERRTRLEALPPCVDVRNGVRFVAPVDQPSGGTWLLANERGVTLAILNLYERERMEPPAEGFHSRGLLLRSLADCGDLDEVSQRLRAARMADYNAFTLIGFDLGRPDGVLRVWRWQHDGESLVGPDEQPEMPVCSSSFAPERVIASRQQIFAELRAAAEVRPGLLQSFHRFDRGGQPSPETVLMRRPDARTLSISRVRIETGRIRFEYEPVPEEGEPAAEATVCELDRR